MRISPEKLVLIPVLTAAFLILSAAPAFAQNNMALIFRGLARTVFSVFEIPRSIIENSGGVPFPVNIVTGTVAGAFKTVAGTLVGATEMARGAAPYAKYAALAL